MNQVEGLHNESRLRSSSVAAVSKALPAHKPSIPRTCTLDHLQSLCHRRCCYFCTFFFRGLSRDESTFIQYVVPLMNESEILTKWCWQIWNKWKLVNLIWICCLVFLWLFLSMFSVIKFSDPNKNVFYYHRSYYCWCMPCGTGPRFAWPGFFMIFKGPRCSPYSCHAE